MPTVHLPDGRIVHFPDGMPSAQITAEVSRLHDMDAGTRKGTAPPARTWTDTAVDALPFAGGAVGSLAGAGPWNPLGMAGAAAGAAGGAFVKQIVNAARGSNDVPTSVSDQYLDAGKEAVTQAALEGGGRLAFNGGAKLVRGLRKLPAPSPAVKDFAVDAALDLVPGGRTMRAAARMGVKAMRGPRAVEEAVAATEKAAPSLATPAIEGFDRYMPNISAAHITPSQKALLDALTEQPAEELPSMFANALREMRSGSLNRARSVTPSLSR